ncbi:MAG: glycoside hydrolase family 88 protein [Bacteroidales bacterium]|nr:glycoside hydrolase family 88 protein [Bacteroidales bacterium]
MKKIFIRLVLLALVFEGIPAILYSCNTNQKSTYDPLLQMVDTALLYATEQARLMANQLLDKPDQLPRTLNKEGELVTSNSDWWCSGFFPGVLWYLYEYNNDPYLKEMAKNYTLRVEDQKYTTTNHDVGFMIFCSFGNGYRITDDSSYKYVIDTAARSLSTRFNPKIGCLRSWDYASWNKQWQYPVIIDNMMNLEMLMWAAKAFNNQCYSEIARTHANTTIENHFRADNSSYHVVSYDTITGLPELKQTSQGYSDESAWARGQAWGLYGFTMMFRESGDSTYLEQAMQIADFIIHHPNLPEDKIPYWDFNAPDIPDTKRDASAGAIMCSALMELSQLAPKQQGRMYLNVAKKQLETLCSNEYLAKPGENGYFILKHGVGHMPNKSEVDVPLTYGDYYFVESLMRYKKLLQINK